MISEYWMLASATHSGERLKDSRLLEHILWCLGDVTSNCSRVRKVVSLDLMHVVHYGPDKRCKRFMKDELRSKLDSYIRNSVVTSTLS